MIVNHTRCRVGKVRAFSLMEVVFAIAIGGVMLSGMLMGYMQAAVRAEWSAYSLAAQSLAVMRLEQSRAAKWDRLAYPQVDQVVSSNLPPQIEVLDIPVTGTNTAFATNITTVTTVSASPPLKMIQVDCIWAFGDRGIYTNTVVTYRAADQ